MLKKVSATKRKATSKSGKRESKDDLTSKSATMYRRLAKEYPEAKTALLHENPFQLLVATILSAQCTDVRVNLVTPGLFRKYPTPKHFAEAHQEELEQDIRSTGFYRMKSKNIISCSRSLVQEFGGNVPKTIEELVTLGGVGRKTANVVLGQAFGIPSGVVVDTHVGRLSQRMGFSTEKSAEKIETDLMELFPKKQWIDLSNILILHGRAVCKARRPLCAQCVVNETCPSVDLNS